MLTSRRFPNRVFAAYYRFTHQIHRPADYPVNTPVFFHRKEIFKHPQNPARMPPDSMTRIRVYRYLPERGHKDSIPVESIQRQPSGTHSL